MASCNLDHVCEDRKTRNSQVPHLEKFNRLKIVFDLLATIESIAEHPKFSPSPYAKGEFDEIIVELKFVAQDYADLYANQKTEYLDYNNLSLTVFIGKAARLIDRSGLPYADKLIFIEKIKKISGNFTKIQNDYAASLQEKRLRAA
jgi:hypothetical protein